MGKSSGGGSPSGTQTVISDIAQPQKGFITRGLGRAEDIAQQPYIPFEGQLFEPPTPDELRGFEQLRTDVGTFRPRLQAAEALSATSAAPITSEKIQAGLSPFQDLLTRRATDEALRRSQLQRQSDQARAAQSGGYDRAREHILEAERRRNLETQLSDIDLVGSQTAFDRASALAESNRRAQLAAGQGLTSIAGTGQQLGLTGADALIRQGQLIRRDLEKPRQFGYQQFLEERGPSQFMSPFGREGWFGSYAHGAPFGTTQTSQQFSAPPSGFGQAAGLGLGLASIYGQNPQGWNAAFSQHGGLVSLAKGGPVKKYGLGDLVDPREHLEKGTPVAAWFNEALGLPSYHVRPKEHLAALQGKEQPPESERAGAGLIYEHDYGKEPPRGISYAAKGGPVKSYQTGAENTATLEELIELARSAGLPIEQWASAFQHNPEGFRERLKVMLGITPGYPSVQVDETITEGPPEWAWPPHRGRDAQAGVTGYEGDSSMRHLGPRGMDKGDWPVDPRTRYGPPTEIIERALGKQPVQTDFPELDPRLGSSLSALGEKMAANERQQARTWQEGKSMQSLGGLEDALSEILGQKKAAIGASERERFDRAARRPEVQPIQTAQRDRVPPSDQAALFEAMAMQPRSSAPGFDQIITDRTVAPQSVNDKLDESLGERRGKESTKKQSYEARRDESRGEDPLAAMVPHRTRVESPAEKEMQILRQRARQNAAIERAGQGAGFDPANRFSLQEATPNQPIIEGEYLDRKVHMGPLLTDYKEDQQRKYDDAMEMANRAVTVDDVPEDKVVSVEEMLGFGPSPHPSSPKSAPKRTKDWVNPDIPLPSRPKPKSTERSVLKKAIGKLSKTKKNDLFMALTQSDSRVLNRAMANLPIEIQEAVEAGKINKKDIQWAKGGLASIKNYQIGQLVESDDEDILGTEEVPLAKAAERQGPAYTKDLAGYDVPDLVALQDEIERTRWGGPDRPMGKGVLGWFEMVKEHAGDLIAGAGTTVEEGFVTSLNDIAKGDYDLTKGSELVSQMIRRRLKEQRAWEEGGGREVKRGDFTTIEGARKMSPVPPEGVVTREFKPERGERYKYYEQEDGRRTRGRETGGENVYQMGYRTTQETPRIKGAEVIAEEVAKPEFVPSQDAPGEGGTRIEETKGGNWMDLLKGLNPEMRAIAAQLLQSREGEELAAVGKGLTAAGKTRAAATSAGLQERRVAAEEARAKLAQLTFDTAIERDPRYNEALIDAQEALAVYRRGATLGDAIAAILKDPLARIDEDYKAMVKQLTERLAALGSDSSPVAPPPTKEDLAEALR